MGKERIWAYHEAKTIADEVVALLQPFCDKIIIGGSIRREKSLVSDVEILCLPKVHKVLVHPKASTQLDMFASVEVAKEPVEVVQRIPEFVVALYDAVLVVEGCPKSGRYVKGIRNEIQVDIFIPQRSDFIRQAIIRTGSRFYVKDVVAFAWSRKGLCGTANGLRKRKECTRARSKVTGKYYGSYFLKEEVTNPWKPPVFKTEEEFFSFLGLPFKEPKDRK